MMVRFILKLAIFVLVAAVGSFWANERFGSNQITAVVAHAVLPITPISDLVRASEQYDGRVVHIVGKLVPHLKLAGLGIGGFVVEDDDGNRIVILTKSGVRSLDATTGRVNIVGIYKQLFEIGPYSYPVIVAG